MNSLTINTSNAKTAFPNTLVYKLRNPLKIEGYVKLSGAWLYYNWKNITSKLGNNKLSILIQATRTRYHITLFDGSYDVEDLTTAIINSLEFQSKYKIPYDLLTPNPVYNRITLTVKDVLEINPGLAYTLGAIDNSKTYSEFKATSVFYNNYYSFTSTVENLTFVLKIENVNRVGIHCSLVDSALQFENTLLYSFMANVSYGSLISLEPKSNWKQTRNGLETEVRIWLSDQDSQDLGIEDSMEFMITIADRKIIERLIYILTMRNQRYSANTDILIQI